MWRDIVLANRAAVSNELAAFRAQLDRVTELVEQGDGDALEALFARARAARRQWEAEQSRMLPPSPIAEEPKVGSTAKSNAPDRVDGSRAS
jgi:hypothetical protein